LSASLVPSVYSEGTLETLGTNDADKTSLRQVWGSGVIVGTAAAPVEVSGSVEDASPTVVTIAFDSDVSVTDSTNMVVSVAAVPATISSVSAADDLLTITIDTPVANLEAVTFDYVATGGNLVATGVGATPVADITAMVIDNLVDA